MSQAITAVGFTQEAFDAFLASRSEPLWFASCGWRPGRISGDAAAQPQRRRVDADRHPLVSTGPSSAFCPSRLPDAALPAGLLTHGVDLAGQTVALNSHPLRRELDAQLGAAGRALRQPRRLRWSNTATCCGRYLHARVVNPAADKFAALHAACWSGGTLLYVPRGVVIDQPLHMLSALRAGATDLGHALVVLEEGSRSHAAGRNGQHERDAPGLHCGAIELIVGPGAAALRQPAELGDRRLALCPSARRGRARRPLQWTIGALGSRLAKVNQHVALVGEGADAQVNGVMFTEGKQHLSYHTLQHHQAPHCRSDLLYKGALQDASRTVWRGMIKVDPGAQKTDGYQRNDNLMLSASTPAAIRFPGLEIQADDVRCTHGSTAGRVDDEHGFLLPVAAA